jgi:hypothetical protein
MEKIFRKGYLKYIEGDWKKAVDLFKACLKIKPLDGPALELKSYIESENLTPPDDWNGYRELRDK